MPYLHVTLRSASDLPSGDFSFVGGKSDPYVTFSVNDTKYRSPCLKNTLDPVWDPPEHYVFPVADALSAVLSVKVYDMDTLNPDDLLGTLVVPVAKFADEMDVSTLEHYPLSLASEFTSQKRDSMLLLEICLKRLDDQERHLYVWENESWCINSGWKSTNDSERQQWSSYDDSATSAAFSEVAPRAPANMEGSGWQYCLNRGDVEGWLYAKTFAGPWTPNKLTFSLVRRRLWENTFKLSSD
ncbi:Ca2-dependent lipid-binding protein CLB1/vesicle protein vp115/Granuphilin A, contains C2 domain [Plasmopara halstedii]|uniref:Ca2-dependent lipid-binding protein CLB1/vesicle protein vp115/Granuphilin A, contains C2 domain n=1 Tax=Plasmopara halstedii TaxID=4781 RepID=A0A0P1ARG8_PLAHL|nr:Ca2-dependent lipid-binding protein CLB1/vesicle protein vp115/Granuphilin A, contains C2 domain [Plasmopara halstedii]CEG43687.1 Ca2-dependent lipid-binding protein CLB1/vesicle protein vp115/Granuphilin A, contains C2 domain [Plasmopara halstedii]|eukprot:XP_024580056.1 Ca2-dependent lipid-binding protein CLB1/vesicle protein vp115/Granuphilin A, contains C2 domain [Plasmopara halstedii]